MTRRAKMESKPEAAMSPLAAIFLYLLVAILFQVSTLPIIATFLIFIYNLAPENVNRLYIINALYSSFADVSLYFIALIFLTASYNTKADGLAGQFNTELYVNTEAYRAISLVHKLIKKQKNSPAFFIFVILSHYVLYSIFRFLINIAFELHYTNQIVQHNYNFKIIFASLFASLGIYFLAFIFLSEHRFSKIVAYPIQYYFWKINVEYER